MTEPNVILADFGKKSNYQRDHYFYKDHHDKYDGHPLEKSPKPIKSAWPMVIACLAFWCPVIWWML